MLTVKQGSSWAVSIAEVVVKILFAIRHYYIYRKKEPYEKQAFADRVGDTATGMLSNMPNLL